MFSRLRTHKVRSLSSQGAISPAVSTRGQSRPLALRNNVATSEHASQTETTQVKHGSEQMNRKDRYACWFACTSLDSLAISRQIVPERGHSYGSPQHTISVKDKRLSDGFHVHSDNQLAAVAACTPSVPRIVPCFASTDRPSPNIDRHFEHAPWIAYTD